MIFFVDYRISEIEKNNLSKIKNSELVLIPRCNNLYEAICGHVDIQLNIIDNKVIVQKEMDKAFLDRLSSLGVDYILSEKSLNSKYPDDIILNAYITDKYFIHNLKFSDKNLLKNVQHKFQINVKQGYTKCSILPLRENCAITSDKKIYTTLLNYSFKVLYVPPNDILLPHLNYGFIGGVGGMIDSSTLALYGSLDYFEYGRELYDFLYSLDIKPLYLYDGKLIDRGSILAL
ncbi:MAG: hypothetical protein MR274_01475 [Clostridium sp.]|nr:hypothetical protein [Clostridium sp.]MDY3827901.1 hypothetical protein [Clostridium sp.]